MRWSCAPATPAKPAEIELVKRYPFTIAFTGEQSRFRSILNQITNTKEQFLIPRTLRIENEQTVGPTREVAAPEVPVSDVAAEDSVKRLLDGTATAEDTQEVVKTLSFIVGNENVKVAMTIDLVDFAAPDQPEGTGATAR